MSQTSVGAGDERGGNEDHGSDGRGNKTLGEQSSQLPPSGKDLVTGEAAKDFPDGPNVGPSPFEKEAAQGKPPRE